MRTITFLLLVILLQDLKAQERERDFIWYNKPANFFEDALPIGNGQLGGMIYGGIEKERISLNDATLWAGYPVDAAMNPESQKYLQLVRQALFEGQYKKADSLTRFMQGKFSASYAPMGNLFLDFGISTATSYKRELELNTGIHKVSFESNGTTYSREAFVSYPARAIFIRLSATGKENLNVSLSFNSLLKYRTSAESSPDLPFGHRLRMFGLAPSLAEPNYRGNMKNAVQYDSSKSMRFVTEAGVFKTDGKVTTVGSNLQVAEAREIILYISASTSFNGFDHNPATEGKNELAILDQQVINLAGKLYETLKSEHTNDFAQLYNRVKLNLGQQEKRGLPTDERLKAFATGAIDNDLVTLYFQFGRYLMISASRTPDVPMNLQGIWNEQVRPPWSSNYTININTEMNYWAAETANLSEMHQPLLGFIRNLSKTGAITAKSFYGAEGWVAHHNSDIWGISNPVGDFGKGDPVWANWTMGGTWLSTHLWEHFLFTGDTIFLKEQAYTLMKGAALFCLSFLIPDKHGSLVTAPATSPENVFITDKGERGAVLFGGTADLAMIREIFNQVLEAQRILGIDKELSSRLKQALQKMYPYRIGKKGNLQEWYYDWEDNDPKHRHVSHLFGLYPGSSISLSKTPEFANAVKKTLE
jgi:alpha-L-fucosidase 2